MSTLDEHLDAIAAAPRGAHVAAFFDFDGTVIDGFSAIAVMRERARRGHIGPAEVARLGALAFRSARGGADFDDLMRVSVRALAGRTVAELDALGEDLASSALGGAVFPEALALVAAHRARGHRVVVASSALPFQLAPIARELGADAVLCTRAAAPEGVFDGTVDGPIVWGDGKAAAVRDHAGTVRIALDRSFGYANGDEDIAFLSVVGHPVAVNPAQGLAAHAARAGWAVVRFARRGRPDAGTIMRSTVAEVAGTLARLASVVPRREFRTIAGAAGAELALGAARVELEVRGRDHLWERRPCVIVHNRQSPLDELVVRKLCDGEVVVAGDAGETRLLAYLRAGETVALAPEGRRSATGAVGPFDARALHVARRAGVPLVPVVIHDTRARQWGARDPIRPGAVRVTVLAPVDAEDTAAAAEAQAGVLRARFAEVLGR